MVLTPAGPGAGAAQGGFKARAERGQRAGSRPRSLLGVPLPVLLGEVRQP